eukprot:1187429-Prorocentrum_minimum.AAC.12
MAFRLSSYSLKQPNEGFVRGKELHNLEPWCRLFSVVELFQACALTFWSEAVFASGSDTQFPGSNKLVCQRSFSRPSLKEPCDSRLSIRLRVNKGFPCMIRRGSPRVRHLVRHLVRHGG